jgi:hypothetical protein
VHDLEIYCLDGVVSIEGVRVVSSLSYFHFVSYVMMLASFCTIDLDRGRLSLGLERHFPGCWQCWLRC